MQPRDYIFRFCANAQTDPRTHLHFPTLHEGRLYASDGSILVVTDADTEIAVSVDTFLYEIAHKHLSNALAAFPLMTPLKVDLPPAETCKTCHGIGRAKDCPTCDGEGEIEGQRGDCPTCGGAGEIHCKDGDLPCWSCEGHKVKRTQPIPYAGALFARRYLALLLELPGIHFTAHPETPEIGCAYFRFDGGYGCLMPVRL